MGRRRASHDEHRRGEQLGKAIARARELCGLTQYALAAKARLDPDMLKGLEQGRRAHPSFFNVLDSLRALGVPSIDDFVARVERAGERHRKG